MKKFQLLTKSLLVAAGLLMGASAWAQTTTTLLEYGTTTAPWSATNIADWTGKTLTLAGDNSYVQYSGTDNSDFANTKTISPTDGNIINVTAVWRGRSNTGRYWSNNCGLYFRFGNIVVAQNDQEKKHGYVFTGLSSLSSVTTFTAGSYRTDIANLPWLKIEAEINTKTNILTSFTIKSEDGKTTYVSQSNVALASPDYTTVAFGFQRGSSHSTEKQEQLKSIKITETTQTAAYADYTVHFVDGDGTKVKEDETRNGEVGSMVYANTTDKETFYSGDYKYIYNNDGNGVEVTSDGNAVLTVTYNKIGKYSYSLNAVDSDNNLLEVLASGEQFTGDDATVYFNKAIFVNNKWYITTYTGNWVFHEATNQNILFTEDATISYFFEVEDINKSHSWAATGAYPDRYSNGKAGRLYKDSYAYTDALEGGVYTVTLWGRNNAGSSDATIGVYVRDAEGNETKCHNQFTSWNAGGGQGEKTIMIEIPDGYSLELKNENADYNSNLEMDYLILRKSGINSMSIVGFTPESGLNDADKWNPAKGFAMTRDADDPAIWTAVVENYIITGSTDTELKYYYKAAANGNFDGYQLPASGNQEYNFNWADGTKGAGMYKLTFTANTMANTVELEIEKQVTGTIYYVNTWNWASVSAWVWNDTKNFTGGTWPGQTMTKTEKKVDGHDVWAWSTYDLDTPTKVMFNDGTSSNKTAEGGFDYENGFTYSYNGVNSIPVTVTSVGYATYCSPYALDFSAVEGLTAYYATVAGNDVSFTSVNKAPKENGLLLKGAGSFDVPVIADTDAETITNGLVGVLADTHCEKGIFVLMNGANGVGFYKTNNDAGFTVRANSAYLPATAAPARTFIGFDGETTAIENVNANMNANGEIYDLQGRRVVAPQKGLYIINGKKVVLK